MKIQTDEKGRRYVIGREGHRIYMPAPAVTDAEREQVRKDAARAAKHIERYHRQFPMDES